MRKILSDGAHDGDLSLTARGLLGFVTAREAAALRATSEQTIEKEFAGQFVWLSPRRKGLRLYQVLALPRPRLPPLVEDEPSPGRHGPSEAGVKPRGVAAERKGRPRRRSPARG